MTPKDVRHTKSIDFSRGRRGIYADREIVIVGAIDETPPARAARRRNLPALVVTIEDRLREHFPTADAVNKALRLVAREIERGKRKGRNRTFR